MSRKKKNEKILTILMCLLMAVVALCASYPLNQQSPMVKDKANNYKEKDYVNAYCKGIKEYRLPDKTRVDCLTEDYAIEFDWSKKWAESIGQALYYSKMTGKKPAVAIIMLDPSDEKYIKRIKKADNEITIFKIKAYETAK